MNLPVLIIGGGGHAKVLVETLRLNTITILGILDADPAKKGNDIQGISVLGNDEILSQYTPASLRLVNGIGSTDIPTARKTVFEKFKRKGFSFATVVHPAAVVASDVVLGEGTQVMAGVVIQPGSRIGANTIINTNVSVDHDCIIGDHVHLAPGVTLSGRIHVEEVVHIGTGATVIQGVTIGKNSLIGAGSVIVSNVQAESEFAGVPGRKIARSS